MIKAQLFPDMPRVDYDKLEGMRKSVLWHGAKSMRHLLHAMQHLSISSPAMDLGSAVHTLTLEPDKFLSEFAVMPKCDGRTKEGKALKQAFAAASVGKIVLDEETHAVAKEMSLSLLAIEELVDILTTPGGMAEPGIQWTDPHTGLLCKCRPDFLLSDLDPPVVLDLKTTRDASEKGFQSAIATFGYHVQAAMYSDAVEILTGNRPVFLFFAVESAEPYPTSYGYLDDAALRIGRDKYVSLLEQYKVCLDEGYFPGYPAEFQKWSLPRWAEF